MIEGKDIDKSSAENKRSELAVLQLEVSIWFVDFMREYFTPSLQNLAS